jgi:hypothetical protein
MVTTIPSRPGGVRQGTDVRQSTEARENLTGELLRAGLELGLPASPPRRGTDRKVTLDVRV